MKQNNFFRALLVSSVFVLGACSSLNIATSNNSSNNSETQSKKYVVTWVVDDKEYSETYIEGETPVYKFGTQKPADKEFTYTFLGWDKEIQPVFENITYTAQYEKKYIDYTYTWVVDGKEYSETYHYGDNATFKEETPTKESDEQYTYTFSGWDKDVSTVTGDEVVEAQFEKELRQYNISFVVDGVKTTESYYYGELPTYNGSLEKASEGDYIFTFLGWDNEIKPVTCDMTYTALFDKKLLEECKINFYGFDGELLYTQNIKEGSIPKYEGSLPNIKDGNNNYIFSGWYNIETNKTYDDELPEAYGEVNYYAYSKEIGKLIINLFDEDNNLIDTYSENILNSEAYTYNAPSRAGFVPSHDYINGHMSYYDIYNVYYSELDNWDGNSVSSSFVGEGTEENPYLINSGADLALLRNKMSNGISYKDNYFKMTKSINLNNSNFTINTFDGIFDGNNCSIRGLNINSSGSSTGLFAQTTAGEIKNLSLYGNIVGVDNIGSFAGIASGLLTNCTNYATVKGRGARGGIVGKSNNTISSCVNFGDVLNAASSGWNVGGIVGEANGYTFGCINNGKVTGSTTHISGVVGTAFGNVEYCENNGSVSGMTIGGAGIVASLNEGFSVSYCINRGEISTNITTSVWTGSIGGIVGKGAGTLISHSLNYGNIDVTISDTSKSTSIAGITGTTAGDVIECTNYGDVKGNQPKVAGVVGTLNNADVSKCYNYGTISGTNTVAGIIASIPYAASSSRVVSNCINYGTIINSSYFGGGICGAVNQTEIIDCENRGDILATGDCCGGIAGVLYDTASITNCHNYGLIQGKTNLGGIVFDNRGVITDCTNSGTFNVTTSNGAYGDIAVNNSGTIN